MEKAKERYISWTEVLLGGMPVTNGCQVAGVPCLRAGQHGMRCALKKGHGGPCNHRIPPHVEV